MYISCPYSENLSEDVVDFFRFTSKRINEFAYIYYFIFIKLSIHGSLKLTI